MTSLSYLHYDVFTTALLEGNQLAVFMQPGDVSADLMQRIARELAFSESTFVFPARGEGDVAMRIFTPAEELPMAGHPTIGTTFALADEGVIRPGQTEFIFELGIGPTPVTMTWEGERLTFAWMTQRPPAFGPRLSDHVALAAAIGIETSQLTTDLPVELISCGVPFLLACLTSRAAVDRVSINRPAFVRACRDAGLAETGLLVFTLDRESSDTNETVYTRMLAPGLGVAEDPATGSASGPLGCFLVRYGLVAPADAGRIVSLQGVAMRRPSRVHVAIDARGQDITGVRVGGTSVRAGRGEVLVPLV